MSETINKNTELLEIENQIENRIYFYVGDHRIALIDNENVLWQLDVIKSYWDQLDGEFTLMRVEQFSDREQAREAVHTHWNLRKDAIKALLNTYQLIKRTIPVRNNDALWDVKCTPYEVVIGRICSVIPNRWQARVCLEDGTEDAIGTYDHFDEARQRICNWFSRRPESLERIERKAAGESAEPAVKETDEIAPKAYMSKPPLDVIQPPTAGDLKPEEVVGMALEAAMKASSDKIAELLNVYRNEPQTEDEMAETLKEVIRQARYISILAGYLL